MSISYKVRGKGPSVILLHGFPMNQEVWSAWAEKLATDFTVYTPDLPGFGASSLGSQNFSLADIAEQLLGWIKMLGIDRSVLVGHSLGGYIAINMVNQEPQRFRGLVLFHSTAYADSEEKKESRSKVIKFIDDNGVEAFTSNFIAPLFADQQHPAIPAVRNITMKSTADTVVGYTKAMRDRVDTTSVLKDFKNPVLFITGEKDPGIPVKTILEQSRLGNHIQTQILEGTGHMGMFEEAEETLTIVKTFVSNLIDR